MLNRSNMHNNDGIYKIVPTRSMINNKTFIDLYS